MGSYSLQVRVKTLKVWMIWQFDQQFSQVISSGRHKPTPVCATGCCKMSPYYLSAAKAEGCVVRQAFGNGLEWEWEGRNTLNTVERWSGQYKGFSLKSWRYIERVNEDGVNGQEGCGAETASVHRRLWIVLCSYSILPFPAVHPNAAHSLTVEPIESILVFHSDCIIVPPACWSEKDFMFFPHLKEVTFKCDVTCCAFLKTWWCLEVTVAPLWSVFLATAMWWDKYWGLSY